ncbi:MAG: hypothetical protein KDC47_11315, partial [Flavobacteriaceae bacterium]|nr:hypothetical protein [Flavobacteriaceae bacterium]
NTSRDAVLRLHNAIIPPKTSELDIIRAFPDLWKLFLRKLSSIEFFSSLSMEERNEWLEKHETSDDIDMAHISNASFEVLQLGQSTFLELEEDDIEKLLTSTLNVIQILNMFKGKPGSEGLKGRHTLIFYLSFWKISVTHKETDQFDGYVIDVEKGLIMKGVETKKTQTILLFENFPKNYEKEGIINEKQTVGFLVSKKDIIANEENICSIIFELFPKYTKKDFDIIKKKCCGFTPASFKSLLQKIIRFRAKKIQFTTKLSYEASFVLVVSISLLLLSPGSFVPDIQRFVSGRESAFKRVVVSLFEDGYIYDENDILTITASAYLSQRCKTWNPSINILKKLFD